MYLVSTTSGFDIYPSSIELRWLSRACLTLVEFLQCSKEGLDCYITLNTFNSEHTDTQLQIIDNRYAGLLTFEEFHDAIFLLHKAYICVSLEGSNV